jgi:hypothetical protein
MISESNNQKYEGINKMETAFSRRDFLKYIGVSLTTLVSSGYANTIRPLAQESKPEKPNILLIVSDDQGWGDTTCNWKNTDIETPVMDEIAKTGIRFTQFYVNLSVRQPGLLFLPDSTLWKTACGEALRKQRITIE